MALYRKLNASGTAITNSNWREWDRMASAAMKMQDFTPPGQSDSLHDLANDVGIEIQALKSRASRPGEKDMMAKFKIGDRVAYKPHAEKTAGELVEIRKPTSLEGVEMQYGIKQAGGAIMWVSEGMVVKASRPGAKATFKVEDRFYFGKGRKERFWARGYDDAKDRVRRSPELGKYAKIIMQPEFDTADHWEWVSRASTSEIVNWAKSISRDM
jgi:hypothetical protein